MNSLQKVDSENVAALAKLFQEFQESTRTLQEAYEKLQVRVAEIDAELEAKNEELQESNSALENKNAELEEVRQSLSNVLKSMNSGVITIDLSGWVTMTNPTAASWLNIALDAEEKYDISDFFPAHVSPCVLSSLSTGQRFSDVEEVVVSREGEERFIRTNAAPIHDANGNRVGALMIFNDITQLKILQEKARRQDRLTALGELAAGVAHEMRNPLTTIRGYIQILPTEMADPEFQEEFLTEALREIDRLTELTDSLLDFSKPISSNIQPGIVDILVQEVVAQVTAQATEKGVELSVALESDNASVLMDRNRVKQVLLNLILNAFDAIGSQSSDQTGPGKRSVMISTGRRTGPSSPDGSPYYYISVQDNGPGIPESIRSRLFDPFFTTKERGTGLGLSVSNRIVQEHGGLIQMSSDIGQGTKFTILLPLHAGAQGVDFNIEDKNDETGMER